MRPRTPYSGNSVTMNSMLPLLPCLVLASLCATQTGRTTASTQAVELGRVSWFRDFDAAKAEAKRLDRPRLVLFQEVPG